MSKESRLQIWSNAVKREQLAAKALVSAQKLFSSGGPDPAKNWATVTAAHESLEAARKAERGSFSKLQSFSDQAGLKFPDESDLGADESNGEEDGAGEAEPIGRRTTAATH